MVPCAYVRSLPKASQVTGSHSSPSSASLSSKISTAPLTPPSPAHFPAPISTSSSRSPQTPTSPTPRTYPKASSAQLLRFPAQASPASTFGSATTHPPPTP